MPNVRSKIRLTLAERAEVPKRSNSRQVKQVYMAVADHGEGEGVFTIVGPSGERLPIVAIDDQGLGALSKYSQEQATASGSTVSIICFTDRKHHVSFSPGTTGDERT